MPKLESKADTKYQLQLPAVSFRVIEDDKTLLAPAGVHSEQIRHYGYNDFSEFKRPDHYIRHIEPIESELAVQVEYDMDEQDKEWLDVVNAERKKEQAGPVSYEMFEIIMDKLEKEWFNLIKRIPQPPSHMPVEDSRCAICDDGEGENSNAIVFCDGCNLAVHQDCYGVPYIPEGQWLCRKCTVSPENPVSCIFCPNEGGAFKQTTTGHWSHLLCAIWIPELTVGNAIYMEPVQDVEQLPKSRWKLNCSLCREKVGACIQCDNKTCFSAFHVTCARQAGLLMTMKTLGTEGLLRAFCDKHLPAEMRDALYSSDDEDSEFEDAPKFHKPKKARRSSANRKTAVTSKTARAHAKSYRPGPPIVPQMIVNKLLEYVHKVALSKRQPFVEKLCRYWSLKREARRGAPLLKRLHLEPWTASSAAKQQTEAEKAVKLKFLTMLRNDLDKVRMLAELTRKREREKLRQAQVIKDMVDSFLFPHDGKLRLALEKLSAMDRQELFMHHVNRTEVPDYYAVIKEPMCWSSIDVKLDSNQYRGVEEFKRDINLVLDNAMIYNPPDNPYHRIAKRIKSASKEVLDQLDEIPAQTETGGDVGNLEPARVLLEVLTARTNDEDERDRLADLFAFELEKPKEPTPPPPTPPPKKAVKRDTYLDRKRRWEEKEAAHQERVAQGRATRAGHARVEAFKHEAGIPSSSDNEVDAPPVASTSRRTRTRTSTAGNAESSVITNTNTSTSLEVPSRTDRASASSGLSRSRSQVGVIRTETVERLSDRERRDRERNMALTTDAVGSADQFTRFNVGWVLPEGSKRNRGGVKQDPVPPRPKPSRKRPAAAVELSEITIDDDRPSTPIQIEAGPSTDRANILASNSPLTPNDSTRDSSLSPPSDISTPAKRRGGTRSVPAPSPLKHTAARLSPRLSRSSSRRRITSGLTEDEPPRKSARMSKGKEPAAVPQSTDMTGEEETAVEDLVANAEDEEMTPVPESDIQLGDEEVETDVDMEEQEEQGEAEAEDIDGEEEVEGQGSVDSEEESEPIEEPYVEGQIVWAKVQGYPYFPGSISDATPGAEDIPKSVFAAKPKAQAAAEGQELYLVNFFDKQNTFGWVPSSKLFPLGVDAKADEMYLSMKEEGKSKNGKSRLIKSVREAFKLAVASIPEGADNIDQKLYK